MNFISSPEIVIALALSGSLSFNPMVDEITAEDGSRVKLEPPEPAPEIPAKGFIQVTDVYVPPSAEPDSVNLIINNNSSRLQKLEPFQPWDGNDFDNLPILAKVKGKCTTDHISPAGTWLMFRGHLDKISDNLLLGAVNAFNGNVGSGRNVLNGSTQLFPEIARDYKLKHIMWIIIGDQNYGEGSSREHAAMTPRYLGCAAIIAKSFARIHETNLKKQGILALTFTDPRDYDKIMEGDKLSLVGLKDLEQGKQVTCRLRHEDGKVEEILLSHSYSTSQLDWFHAGSALNVLRRRT